MANLLSSNQAKTYTLVQKAHSQTVKGYACELQVSTFRAYCGIYSHVKMGQALEIAHHVPLGREECETMIRTLQYPWTDRDEPVPLKLDQSVYFSREDIGIFKYDDYNEVITCEGVHTQIGEIVHKDYMRFTSNKLTLSVQHFLVQNKKTIESITATEMLPCSPAAGYCQTGTRTYLWDGEFSDCPFVAIKNITAKTFGHSHLVAESDQLVLNLTHGPETADVA